MSTERFPAFSPSSILGLLNSTIQGQKTLSTAGNGTFIQNTDPHNGLLLITAFFTFLKLINITSGRMGKPKDIREVVTGSPSAAKECQMVFSTVNPAVTSMGYPVIKNGASVCWLCGFTIDQMGEAIKRIKSDAPIWSDSVQNANAANAPECEHIVPAGAAMIYLDIQSRKRRDGDGAKDLYYNYEWSHKFCNATASDGKKGEGVVGKSDKLFFNMLDQYGNLLTPAVNEYNIDLWLSRLAKTTIMSTLIGNNGLNVQAWMNTHKPRMSERVKKVCDYIVLKRSNYPTIFGQGVGSQLGGDDAVTPATPFLGDPQNTAGPGLMVGDLLNLARNVSIVYNELLGKSTNLALLEAKIFSQSMLHLISDMGMVGNAIIENRYTLATQTAFFNANNNGLLNGVFPYEFVGNVLLPRQQADGTITPVITPEHNKGNFKKSYAVWKSIEGPLEPPTHAAIEASGELPGWTYEELMKGFHNRGGKRKKTHRNKLKQKRTRRNKNSKK